MSHTKTITIIIAILLIANITVWAANTKITMPSQSYIGLWHTDYYPPDELTILEISKNTIRFELGIHRTISTIGTAKIEKNKIVFTTEKNANFSGTMEFNDNSILLFFEKADMSYIQAGRDLSFTVKVEDTETTHDSFDTPITAEILYDGEDDFQVMTWRNSDDVMITVYRGNEQTVRIPQQISGETIMSIGEGAFANKQLSSVTIPNTIKTIWGQAFANNPITSVTIGENVDFKDYGHVGAFDRDDDFERVYYSGGKQAGTYTLDKGVWSLQGGKEAVITEELVTLSKVSGKMMGYLHFYTDQQTNARFIIRAKESVEKFAYFEVKQNKGGGLVEGKTLFSLDDFTPEKPLVISANISEGIPTRGIRFLSRGSVHYYYLTESGVDGSLNLVEFAPKEY